MRHFIISTIAALLFGAFGFASQTTIYHQDGRAEYVKLQVVQGSTFAKSSMGEKETAANYLVQHADIFGLTQGIADLEIVSIQESLLGKHFHFAQSIHGIPVYRAEIVVSVSSKTGSVYQVYNNTYPVTRLNKTVPEIPITWEDSYDIAWQDLKVHGELLERPASKLVYIPQNGDFRLAYLVTTAVEAPFGYWQHTVDSITGEITDVQETTVSEKSVDFDFHEYTGEVFNRINTLKRFEERMQREQDNTLAMGKTLVNGTGKVFDPDPVTTLQNDNLEDTSSASSFTSAYFTRTLLGINQSGSTYSLTGPWVTISNFESPNTAPSTTTTGNWTAVRGNNSFNDAMTYFQVDQSQRYIQSLGFTGSTGIQYNSISIDTDGVNGDDNSHFIPSTNRLAFGHGCVDDNEDTYVILHEYGHAIQHSINSNWSGGDTGAMGEGFGDYWAGSYRNSTPNGGTFHPAWSFPFDGHNNCWGGRTMDKTSFQYDPSNTYTAHATVGGILGDELWSTPLFQALVTLKGQGVPRSEVDRIILQAHFGLGSGLSMRDMATAIVNTAQQLYPSGNHKSVFEAKFVAQNILTGSTPPPTGSVLQNGVTVSNLSDSKNGQKSFTLEVPAGATNLHFNMSGGSGDADLYVKFGSAPTTSSYGYRSWATGNTEAVSISSPSTGTYYVMINAYAAYSGASLTGSYDAASTPVAPDASFTQSINDLSVSFTDTSSDSDGSISSRAWTFGDGATSSSQNPSHTYASAGTYTVRLTVTDNDGMTDFAEKSITVTAPANVAPTASFTQSVNNLSVSFTDQSSDSDGSISSWSWNFGDGNTSIQQNPSHTYSSAGSYSVSLNVTDNGGLSSSTSHSVSVTAPPAGNTLQNGVPVGNISGAYHSSTRYTIDIPAGASNLKFVMSGGTGDGDLYVKFGSDPTTSSYGYRSWNSGNGESITINSPSTGTYHVLIYAYSAFSGATLTASYDAPSSGGGHVTETKSGSLSGKASKYYTINVSGGTIDLSATWVGSRDIDLYIYNPSGSRVASGTSVNKPEVLSYNTNGVSGAYQVRVYNYSSSTTDYTLTMEYDKQ